MADNIELPGDGVTIASDDVGAGLQVQRVKMQFGVDGTSDDVSATDPMPVTVLGPVDAVTGAIEVISYEHHEIHSGSHYFVKTVIELSGAGDIEYFMFRTPDTSKRVHAQARIGGNAEFDIEIFEDPTTTADGTPVTTINNERDSANTSELLAFGAPTVTADGDRIWYGRIGTGRDATVSAATGYEILAATDTDYLFKVTKAASGDGYVDVDFSWYEHAPA